MYDKEKIDELFRQYVESGEDEILWKLIEACKGVIEVGLSRYNGSIPRNYCEEINQDVSLKLFKNLKEPRKKGTHALKKRLGSPYSYLFFLIKQHINYCVKRYNKIYGREISLSQVDYQAISKIQDDSLDPEKLYIIRKELPKEFFEDCRSDIESDPSLRNFPILKEEKIKRIRYMIEESLGIEINNEV